MALATQGAGQLQVAAGGRVQNQHLAAQLVRQAGDVGEVPPIVVLDVGEQGPGRGNAEVQAVAAKAREVAGAEVGGEHAPGGDPVEMPVRVPLRGEALDPRDGRGLLGDETFHWVQPCQFGGQFRRVAHLQQAELAGSELQAGNPVALLAALDCG